MIPIRIQFRTLTNSMGPISYTLSHLKAGRKNYTDFYKCSTGHLLRKNPCKFNMALMLDWLITLHPLNVLRLLLGTPRPAVESGATVFLGGRNSMGRGRTRRGHLDFVHSSHDICCLIGHGTTIFSAS